MNLGSVRGTIGPSALSIPIYKAVIHARNTRAIHTNPIHSERIRTSQDLLRHLAIPLYLFLFFFYGLYSVVPAVLSVLWNENLGYMARTGPHCEPDSPELEEPQVSICCPVPQPLCSESSKTLTLRPTIHLCINTQF